MEHLFTKLKQNSESDIYPYHMPGHKRRPWGDLPADYYSMDITEVDGFDNLHQPEDILKKLQDNAARMYGAEESFYLVNGSTSGILSAISAAVPNGGHILIARNCHKSVYHAIYLRNIKVSFLYPPRLTGFDICDAVTAVQVSEALEREKDIDAVLIVSPTYEGRIADVKSIAEVVHRKGIPLIVDEAHGAHLGFAKGFAQNSCRLGADLVIHSVHKTLPALTQTALLHINGSLINREKVKRFLRIYQSSSPSYLLMASIDNALRYVEREGENAFEEFANNYQRMLATLTTCNYLNFLWDDYKKQDVGKLVISVSDEVKCPTFTGKYLYDLLLHKYHLQLEMASDSYALAMFTINDDAEAYQRMTDALLEIDNEIEIAEKTANNVSTTKTQQSYPAYELLYCENPNGMIQCDTDYAAIPLTIAWDSPRRSMLLNEAVGYYAAEFVNLYPPGIPLLIPGEIITQDICRQIVQSHIRGLNVQGVNVIAHGIQCSEQTKSNNECEDIYISVLCREQD